MPKGAVPALVDMPTADAKTVLANANLVVGATTQVGTNSTIAKGNVSGVKPPAGTLVDAGSTVDLEKSTPARSPGSYRRWSRCRR